MTPRPRRLAMLRFASSCSAAIGIAVMWIAGLASGAPALATQATAVRATGPRGGERPDANLRLARDLIDVTLAGQLRKLRENGLADQSLYAEIEAMRSAIQELAEHSMVEIADLIRQAESRSVGSDQRRQRIAEARRLARDVAMGLIGQRQALQRRLQANSLVEDWRSLLQRMQASGDALGSLRSLADREQEAMQLQLVEDLNDVALLESVWRTEATAIAGQAGPFAALSAAAARTLEQGGTEALLIDARRSLRQGDWDAAATALKQAETVWFMVLSTLSGGQGDGAAWTEVLRRVRGLAEDQQNLLQTTRDLDWNALDAMDRAADAQQTLHQSLTELQPLLAGEETLAPWLAATQQSAMKAMSAIFQGQATSALEHQLETLQGLQRMQQWLLQAVGEERRGRSAADLGREAERLEELNRRLRPLWKRVRQESADSAAEVGAELARLREDVAPWDWIATRRGEAQRAAEAAAEDPSPDALQRLEQALQQLISEVSTRGKDAQREHLAVSVGELARAAEALERVAAALRETASRIPPATEEQNLAELQTLARRQEDASRSLQWIQQGVQTASPQAATGIHAALQRLSEAREQLAAIDPTATTSQLGAARSAEDATRTASDHLLSAAERLRRRQTDQAGRLAELAQTQALEVHDLANSIQGPASEFQPTAAAVQAAAGLRQAWQWQLQAIGDVQGAEHDRWLQTLDELQHADRALQGTRAQRTRDQRAVEWRSVEPVVGRLVDIARRRDWTRRGRLAESLQLHATAIQQAIVRGAGRAERQALAAWGDSLRRLRDDAGQVAPLPPVEPQFAAQRQAQAELVDVAAQLDALTDALTDAGPGDEQPPVERFPLALAVEWRRQLDDVAREIAELLDVWPADATLSLTPPLRAATRDCAANARDAVAVGSDPWTD